MARALSLRCTCVQISWPYCRDIGWSRDASRDFVLGIDRWVRSGRPSHLDSYKNDHEYPEKAHRPRLHNSLCAPLRAYSAPGPKLSSPALSEM